jgi:alpha-ribazole phosphatase
MTEIILIRHGETDWNIEGRYQGQSDVPLNQNGIQQAKEMANRIRHYQFNAIISSDLSRAKQTAEILSETCESPLQIDPRLREINQGEWEGMLYADIRSRYSKAFEERLHNPLDVAPPGGETVGQVRDRVLEAIQEIVEQFPDGIVAIVSHGLSLAIIKVHFNHYQFENVWDHIPSNAKPERIFVEVE